MADSAIVGNRKVVEVLPGDAKQGSKCKIIFEDGGEIEADLVAGCDGVWSRVRKAVLGEEVKPIYQGLTGVGGFVHSDKLEGVDGRMRRLEAYAKAERASGFDPRAGWTGA